MDPIKQNNPNQAGATAWTDTLLENPHAVRDKAARVHRMFAAIAPSYDLNNRLHSLGLDQYWRRVAVRMAQLQAGDRIVDVACGTGDLTLAFAQALRVSSVQCPVSRDAGGVVGVDFTFEMLPLAREKARRRGLTAVEFGQGDALALPLEKGSVDVVSIAFGIRNVADWGGAIEEFARVLKPGGRLVVLEFSLPRNGVLRGLYNFYFRRVMPVTATWISGDKTGAYRYLPESVNTFISREAMVRRMEQAGFERVEARPLTCGICVCYRGLRRT